LKITPATLRKLPFAALALGVLLALVTPAQAQGINPMGDQTPPAVAPAQPMVDEIVIRTDRPQQISTDSIRAHILQHEKTPYNQELMDRSIESLYATGDYGFIRTDRENLPDGGIRVILYLFPKNRVSAVVFKGNKAYTQSRLTEEIKTVAGDPLDPSALKHDTDKLIEFYQKKGYSNVKVEAQTDPNDNLGTVVVTFAIDEGPDVVISSVDFVGNNHEDTGTLRGLIDTANYVWFISFSQLRLPSWITGSGRYQKEQFLDDLDKLRKYYKSKGYLDVDIPEDEIKYTNPTPTKLVITIAIHEGRQYHVGKSVTISGNTIFRTDTLMALLKIKPGDVFSPEEVDKNADAIKDYYGKSGYLDTFVRVDRKPDLETGDIGLDFVVMHVEDERVMPGESEKFYVEGIDIHGNTRTKSSVIVRELSLSPGDVFDTSRMKASEDKLKGTGFFEPDVTLTAEDTNIPGKRNLRINLQEARTFSATFGAGFDPVQGALAYVEFSESNFDLFNYRTNFRGGGQSARVKLTLGNAVSGVEINYEYPWLYERNLTLGTSLFHTESSYYSSTFNEEDSGVTVYMRKPLIEFIDGNLSYTVEDIQIRDVTAAAPPPIHQDAGNKSVSKIGLDLVRTDNMDSLTAPTKGNREEFLTEFAGGPLGGQTNFYRLEGHFSWWYPTFGYRTQVLSFSVRGGTISGYDGKGVPYAERYFLGGDYNLRGYSYRNVGPRFTGAGPAAGQPLGGNSFAVASTEYSIELFSNFRFAVFHDIGFVNSDSFDFSPGGYQQDVGFGFRFYLLSAPVRVDMGFPLNPNTFQSKSLQFNFAGSLVY